MITNGDKLYWITKDEAGEIDGVEVYQVVPGGGVYINVMDSDGKKHSIRRRNLGRRAFFNPFAPMSILLGRREDMEAEHRARMEHLAVEISKLEEKHD